MAGRGKKYRAAVKNFENKPYPLSEAITKAKGLSYSKFPASIELHYAMVLPKDKDPKSLKGSVSLPHPTESKESRIIVFCEQDKAEEAKTAGAVEAGLDDLIKKIQGGWMDFDVALATPDVMGKIAVLGKQLGPRGLMPNPKTGTLTTDIKKSIAEFKKGKTKFASDTTGVVHVVVGTVDTADKDIEENIKAVLNEVSSVVGKPIPSLTKSVTLSATMGAGVTVDLSQIEGKV